ncbi:ABC transporter permease [Patescibacteria group bacterium AH-259-L07]|nr:ABC transporter permease [Patescibacteria group bacterium AH-259-L07]
MDTTLFKLSIRNLKTRPIRSWLTIIGVVIGVFLIISLLSLSEGIKTAVLQQLRMMGKDLVMVFPGEISDVMVAMTGDLKLSDEDIEAIKKTKGVENVVPMAWKAEVMGYKGEKKTVLIYGNPWKDALEIYKRDMGWQLFQGRWPVPGKREIIVGDVVPKDVFPGMKINTEATIAGKKFEIVGVLKSLGNKQDDSMIGMDLEVFRQITGERKGAQFVLAKTSSTYAADDVVERIKTELQETRKRRRGEDLPSFTVLSSEKITDIVGNIMGIIQVAIFALASIAIIVGGIGIMNTMYTATHERIKEIGVMKAVGAKNTTITMIFLIESGILGFVGGLGGTVLGIGLAKIMELYFQVHPIFYLKASASPWLILFGLLFSFFIGCISGFLPARSASKLNPVDALRYE